MKKLPSGVPPVSWHHQYPITNTYIDNAKHTVGKDQLRPIYTLKELCNSIITDDSIYECKVET
jgi:hypothetical protein